MQKRYSLVVVFVLISAALFSQKKITSDDLELLKNRMVGAFNSTAQAAADTSYFDIHLNMVQIWPDRLDGYWLYVEQAAAKALNRPYRQRVYHLYMENRKTLVSKVYEMSNPLRFAGAYNKPTFLAQISFDSLIDRQGCAIYLRKDKEGNYYGSTPGKECLSSLKGASYATSEVVIYSDKLISWDRGWNDEGKQVWGAQKGGYVFLKQKE
jgi:hypothetical protein